MRRLTLLVAVLLTVGLAGMPRVAVAQETADTTPPEVVELVLTPSHVVLEEGQEHAWVTVRARITDDRSGVRRTFSFAVTNHDSFSDHLQLTAFELVSGDANDGVYEAHGLVDATTVAGSYWARSMFLEDQAGNRGQYWTLYQTATGHPADLHVGPATPPSVARDVVATAGDRSATVSWLPPRFDGTRAITGYEIVAAPGGATLSAPAHVTSVEFAGLENGTAYTFTVVARNDVGGSGPVRSRAVRATATPDAPDVTPPSITSLALPETVVVGDEPQTLHIDVDFTDDISGSGTYYDEGPYVVLASPDGQMSRTYGSDTVVAGHELDGTIRFVVTLPPYAAEGTYSVAEVLLSDAAQNHAIFTGAALTAAGHRTTFDVVRPRVPAAVTDLTATAVPHAVDLAWTAPDDTGSAAISGYEVRRNGDVVAQVAGDTTAWTDTAVPTDATLTYGVAAINSVGRGALSSTVVQTLGAPDAVRDLTAVAEPGAAKLAWERPTQDGGAAITGYRVARDGQEIAALAPDTTQFFDEGLAADTEYTYTVVAVNDVGTSAAAQAAVRTPATPSAPQNLTARGGSGVGEIVTSWEAPASDGRSAILGYQVFRDGSLIAEVAADTMSYTDSGRSLLETPQYTVAAVNAVGVGAVSSSACSAPSPWPAAISAQLCDQAR